MDKVEFREKLQVSMDIVAEELNFFSVDDSKNKDAFIITTCEGDRFKIVVKKLKEKDKYAF